MRADAPATDLGNAERFARAHGARVRFVHASETWILWDGRRWSQDRDGGVYRLAVETVCAIYGEASGTSDRSARESLGKHAVRSEAQPRLEAMLELAKNMEPIATRPEAFDRPETTYLINVENGTLDLRTAVLRQHDPHDFITKLAPVMYEPAARSAVWEEFLAQQVPDADVRTFLARAAGATLTGDTSHEQLFFVYGPAASGKSTFTEALKAVLGPYAVTCPFETFLRKRGGAGVGDDIARLAGARMVLAGEPDEGRTFDAASLKKLTGGDVITARHLYERHFEFKPQSALWLVGNHRPQANAQDGALWRRVLLVPFERTLAESERDPAVKACLTRDAAAQQAILAWAVAGAFAWQADGLQPPDAVRVATERYRSENDAVGRFLAETYDPAPDEVPAKDLRKSYTEWCEANGERPLPSNQLGDVLRAHGLTNGKSGGARCWRWPRPGQQDSTDSRTAKLLSIPPREEEFPPSAVPAVLLSPAEERRSSDPDRDRCEAEILRALEAQS
jgi:putative DNA primase/helicase